ncbi:MAG: hypothetical protein KF784_15005 [Fimbriimonadaceae bacterium]|nr:hypothetical protein [Fimbriimonadaceae bacterium]
MAILPPSRPKATRDKIESIIAQKGVQAKVVLVGVRGYYQDTMGAVGKNDIGIYDDALFIVTAGGFWSFNGNTDPSIHRQSIATLKIGTYKYKPGMHGVTFNKPGYPYPAFVQAEQVTVKRDGSDKDFTGWFGINIHKGSNTKTSSEGCQTVPPPQWEEFRNRLNAELKAASATSFPYILVNAKDVGL